MKSDKGITLIMLVLTVIVLLIIVGAAINVGYTSYKNAELNGYVATMNMIQARVNVLMQKIENGDTSYNSVGIDFVALDTETMERINVAVGGVALQGYKYYDQGQLELLGLENIKEEVIINLTTGQIISLVPVEYKNEKYYNQYNLPNGIQKGSKGSLETQEPEFTIEKNNYGLTTEVNITNIVYDPQIHGSAIYYGEVLNSEANPVTVSNWTQVQGTSFNVTKTAKYAVKLVDKNGGELIKTVDVVTCNAPELTDGMVPVIYENGKWKKVAQSEIGKWYDYAEGKWANIMLSDGIEIAADGTISQMGSMFVWIPRYAYQITSNYHNGGEGISGNINVKFLKDKTYVTTEETTTKMINASGLNNWNVHPAFIDGSENNYANGGWDRELTGFWVAKFEASSTSPNLDYGGGNVTNLDIKVIPNVTSWREITIPNCFTNCLNMNKTGNIYGLPTNAVTHLMKNSEWGAVAYLTQSKYGRNGTEVTVNNSLTYITGNGADFISQAGKNGVTNAYNTEKGVLASTTGTIYGIYDMSGCSREFVAAGLTTAIDNGKFALKTTNTFEEKFVDRYSACKNSVEGYENNKEKYGDSMYEVSKGVYDGTSGSEKKSWHADDSHFPRFPTYSFITRGGQANGTYHSGIFDSGMDEGNQATWKPVSFRPTIVVE